jgi:nucleoside-diphosphate kinase
MTEDILVFLKPDAVIRRYIGARTIKEFLDAGFKVKYFGEAYPSKEFIETKHYAQHRGKFFYDWLVDYVASSHLLVFILTGNDVIYEVRKLLGATIPENADWNSIRGRYGIFGGINVAHASDNVENGKREIDIWKKDIIKIQKNCDYTERANAYITKYIDSSMVDTLRYREISKKLMNEKINEKEAKYLFINLLSEESDLKREIILRFAEIMVRNALSRKEVVVKK